MNNQKNQNFTDEINQSIKEESLNNIAKNLGYKYINLQNIPINRDFLLFLPEKTAKAIEGIIFHKLVKKINIAVLNPNNEKLKEYLNQMTDLGYKFDIYLITEESFQLALKLYEKEKILEQQDENTQLDLKKIKTYEQEISDLKELKDKLKKSDMKEALNLLMIGAYKSGASDIHIDPAIKTVQIKFRIDGVLHDILKIDYETYNKIKTQLKFNSKIKLNIKHIPQDGRFSFLVNNKNVDVRVSSLPSSYDETFVLRILDSTKGIINLDNLGFSNYNMQKLNLAISKSHGMLLVTGPTGSGKTTTLYAIIQKLKKPENKIITLEDPIEYNIDDITQSQVQEDAGYTFINGLKAIVRQDPDIIMVGEMRDKETASIGMQSALTGHIILSTLHTNSSIESISRLINMGIEPYIVAPSLNSILSQRLVRKLCDKCKQKLSINTLINFKKEIQVLNSKIKNLEIPKYIYEANEKGCPICSHTGYKGQTVVSEILIVDDTIKDMIFKKQSITDIKKYVYTQGFINIREDGLYKVLTGNTSIYEINRVATL